MEDFIHHKIGILQPFIEAIWVNYQLGLQGDHRFAMVWGGSNAFRRELLQQGEIIKRWENAHN